MRPWLKITLKTIGILLSLIVLAWLGLAFYVTRNKATVLSSVLAQLNKNTSGQITAKEMEPALLRGFPGISITLKDVLVRDSLWHRHKNDLVKAKQVNLSLNILSLIAGTTNIKRIGIEDAQICLFTDAGGYSNTSMFKKGSTAQKGTKESPAIEVRNIDFKNVRFIVDNRSRFKRFDFAIAKLRGDIKYPLEGFKGTVYVHTLVNSFAFNTRRGSFLKDKNLSGTLRFHYDKIRKTVVIAPNKLNIGEDGFTIGAAIQTDKSAFSVDIAADKIPFKNIALLLAPNISSKLLRFAIDKPINVKGRINDPGTGAGADPEINVTMEVRNAIVKIPSGQLEKTNFIGTFNNHLRKGQPAGDENSVIHFTKLTADYFNVPISVDTFSIHNLAHPIATGRVRANFPLTKLNDAVNDDIVVMKGGNAALDLYCKTDIENFRFTKPVINGNVKITDADITYLPRKMRLVKSALTLNFTQTDLTLRDSRFQLGKSVVNMDCKISNFLNLYYTAPEKIYVTLKMSSPQLYLNEFLPFLGPRTSVKRTKKNRNSLNDFMEQFGNVIESSQVNLQLKVNKAIYKKFIAQNLLANIDLIGTNVFLRKVSVTHAGGKLDLSGNIRQSGARNNFSLNSNITSVNVKEFFHAFDNFGQTSITDRNLQGLLSSKVEINGAISNEGTIAPRSINGKVAFSLRNAALRNFEPMEKAGKFAFANRNFSDIRMPVLDGSLLINGEKVTIQPMEISSSVLNMDVRGIYSLGKGTDIAMDIPLRNPEKDKLLSAAARRQNRMKGIVLRLKAVDGTDGKVKIRWNGGGKKPTAP